MRLFVSVSLAACVSAYVIRDDAPLNQTITIAPTPTASPWPEEPEIDTETTTQSRQLRPHPEVSVPGFEDSPSTTSFLRNGQSTAPPDIGSMIQSFLTTAIPPAVHTELSEDGWEVVTSPIASRSRLHGPHMEISTDGFDEPTHAPAPNNKPQVTAPGTQVTPPPYVSVPAATPPPVITQGGIVLQPVPVTRVRVTNVNGKPTTVEAAVNYQYVVGSATLTPGTTTTINNVAVALSLDAAGRTVLVAGDTTTTLPAAPARAAQATTAQDLQIATTVVDGTTKYLLAGQTLAPGQAITVGNIPISMGTAGASQTVLVLGDVTTTLADGPLTTSRKEWGASSAVTPGVGGGNGPINPSATTRSGEISVRAAMSWRLVVAANALCLGLAFAT